VDGDKSRAVAEMRSVLDGMQSCMAADVWEFAIVNMMDTPRVCTASALRAFTSSEDERRDRWTVWPRVELDIRPRLEFELSCAVAPVIESIAGRVTPSRYTCGSCGQRAKYAKWRDTTLRTSRSSGGRTDISSVSQRSKSPKSTTVSAPMISPHGQRSSGATARLRRKRSASFPPAP
jgi:hypothetical protein